MGGEEMGTRKEFGGSLPVANVQALASNNSGDIPLRYLRPELQSEEVLADESPHIPIIDMRKLMVDDDEMEKLHFACKDWGFFQLINHGVEEVIEKMKMDVQEFFKLPLEEKNAYAQPPNNIEGYGQAFVVSQDQKLDWGDMLFLLPLPASQRNMRLWPENPTSFRETLDKYSSELHRVSINLLRSMAKNLGVNPDKLASMFEGGTQGVRMNYYPPCVHADKVMGLTPHSDAAGLTLLVQVNEVQGLQIKKNGQWVPIKPVPDAFIVNIGDVIEIMSNGEYKSIEHRAVVNPEKECLSIAAFHSPDHRTMIGPLPDLIKENSAKYKTTSHEDFLRIIVTRKLDDKAIEGLYVQEMGSEEMSTRKEFGGSLPVANVQALASNNSGDIPIWYLRPELQSEEVLVGESLQIPTIDMRKLMVDDDEMEKLHFSCKHWGFFQLINHGVEEEVIDKMKMDVQEFFKLSLEEKNAYAQPPNDIEGYGQAFVVSQDQKLDWGDMLFLLPLPASQRKMRLWPEKPTSFRETLDKYSSELHRVSINLLRSIAKNLGINPDKLANIFEDGTQGVRMNYYPPCVNADKVMGLTPHSDATGLTLLVQVNEVQGLQIKKNGKWVPIKPVPDAFIVNIGDIIEIMSNGEYKSIEHRAVVNPEKERLSIAAFHSPNYRTMIGPLPDLIKENSAKYKTISFEDFLRIFITRKLDGKSLLGHMKFAD